MTVIDLPALITEHSNGRMRAVYPQTVAAGLVARRLRALGARVSHEGELPVPLRLSVYQRGNPVPVGVLDQIKGPKFQDQLNEPGAGSFEIANDDPDLSWINADALVMFELHGYAAFTMLPREMDRSTIPSGEDAAALTAVSGPGHLAALEEALVYPSRGLRVWPIEDDRVFSWPSTDYEDTWWGPAAALAKWSDATVWTTDAVAGSPPAPGEFPDPGCEWIWAPGSSWMLAPGGPCYGRTQFQVPAGMTAVRVYYAFDATGTLYFDGQEVGTNTWALDTWKASTEVIPVTAGWHTLACVATNDYLPAGEENQTQNPGGMLVTVYGVGPAGLLGQDGTVGGPPLCRTSKEWKFLSYPATEPGMTPGEAIVHCVKEAQARGALNGLQLAFDGQTDSGGAPWPIVGDIATKVGTDLLTFLRELSGTYVDFAMAPGSMILYAWSIGQRGEHTSVAFHRPTNPADPWSGNVGQLKHKRAL